MDRYGYMTLAVLGYIGARVGGKTHFIKLISLGWGKIIMVKLDIYHVRLR